MDFKRIVPSLALLCLGVGMLVYGVVFHTVTIFEEEETEVSIPIPAPFAPSMPFGADDPSLDHGFQPPADGSFAEMDPFGSGAPPDDLPAGDARNPFEQGAAPDEVSEENPFAASPEQPGEVPSEEPPWFPDPSSMMFERVTQIELVAHTEPEWVLVREMTFGGVARLENGELKRTYSGKPPALCPT